MEISYAIEGIREAARRFLQQTAGAKVYAFHGEMGAGKTTFIHAVCDELGIKDVVGSPTFSIINEYLYFDGGTSSKLYHIDLYRLKDEEEAMQAGVEDCLNSGFICFVEWPEKAPALFPDDTVHVFLQLAGPQIRTLRIERN